MQGMIDAFTALEKGITTIGAAIIAMGVALGMGKMAGVACEAIARQPEAGPKIQAALLIVGALIEGVALFALVICLLAQ